MAKYPLQQMLDEGYVPIATLTTGAQVLVQTSGDSPLEPSFDVAIAGGIEVDYDPGMANNWRSPDIYKQSRDWDDRDSANQYYVSHSSGSGNANSREMGEVLIALVDFVKAINVKIAADHALLGAEFEARRKQWRDAEREQDERDAFRELMTAHNLSLNDGEYLAVVDTSDRHWIRVDAYQVQGDRLIVQNIDGRQNAQNARNFLKANGGGTLIYNGDVKQVRAGEVKQQPKFPSCSCRNTSSYGSCNAPGKYEVAEGIYVCGRHLTADYVSASKKPEQVGLKVLRKLTGDDTANFWSKGLQWGANRGDSYYRKQYTSISKLVSDLGKTRIKNKPLKLSKLVEEVLTDVLDGEPASK